MKLIEALQILKKSVRTDADRFSVGLACSFTPLHLQTMLAAHLRALFPDHQTEIQPGLYGDLQGNLERFAQSHCDACAVVLEWADLDARLGVRSSGTWTPDKFPEILAEADDRVSHIVRAIEVLQVRIPVSVSLPSLPLPPISHTPGWQAGALGLQLRECISSLGCRLVLLPNVRLVNSEWLDQTSPPAGRFDVNSEIMSGFPYHLAHASALAEALARLVRNRSPKKGLITDLDDTLWRGILGEVGVDGISWDLDHHSQMHGQYQRLLGALSEEGILVGAASKNDASLVSQVFRERELNLPPAAVFPLEVHWEAKSESVARILKIWNIAADDVVFVDDSPMELAEVKAAHPQIECIEFPTDDVKATYQLLYRLRDLFGKSRLLEEDAIRVESVRRSHASQNKGAAPRVTGEHLLEQAEAEITLNANKQSADPRVLELINKTNQFNLNGRRFTEVSWRNYLEDPNAFLLIASYRDKYGPLGKIAVIAGRHEQQKLFIETWVMSCRAFSRRIEHRCLEELFQKYGVNEIAFDFVETPRNRPIQSFLEEICSAPKSSGPSVSRHDFFEKRPACYHRVRGEAHG
jgi:FkbH-like protein